ncbi:MAG TPA: hypothetical protein VD794_00970 [Flavisolibacter sp.]|nr:hypothetical protein [Flavisolibacter sp.]
MKNTTLQFPDIQVMIDFQMAVQTERFFINRTQLTIRGHFTPADAELAQRHYHARVIDEQENARYLNPFNG